MFLACNKSRRVSTFGAHMSRALTNTQYCRAANLRQLSSSDSLSHECHMCSRFQSGPHRISLATRTSIPICNSFGTEQKKSACALCCRSLSSIPSSIQRQWHPHLHSATPAAGTRKEDLKKNLVAVAVGCGGGGRPSLLGWLSSGVAKWNYFALSSVHHSVY